MGQAEAGSFSQISHMSAGGQALRPSLVIFPVHRQGTNWIGSGVAGTQASAQWDASAKDSHLAWYATTPAAKTPFACMQVQMISLRLFSCASQSSLCLYQLNVYLQDPEMERELPPLLHSPGSSHSWGAGAVKQGVFQSWCAL